MFTETLDSLKLLFEYEDDNRFTYSSIKKDVDNKQLNEFAIAFNSLQKNVAHSFFKEERFILENK